ncbi:GNAT family N-acetyltransferase [Chryseobacterium sp. MFBS3-17]|uniref:GNAT family N-acetyltransferase n=1 Tax=Chryseobacterium sp. MFBS3-17 TaxID=2886689 RepID=UPI001D0E70D4|nr:GNAT family N-acetyltransferase [Chryseobacterium sp. MFBS3-17]MCC2590956.1 GNAT family N-acetyltransferase [Chryseobacterium sp. MFBS3-17]
MVLIKASEADIPLLQKIAEESWRANYEGILSTAQMDYMLAQMYGNAALTAHFSNPDYEYYIIQPEDGKNVGLLGFEHHYEPGTTKLHRIYLLKECKGRGFGKQTMDFLKKEVAQLGDQRIILNVNKGNPALAFYQSQGFQVYDEGVFDIGSGFVMDDYLMEFHISAGNK